MATRIISSTVTPTASKATEVNASLGSLGTLPRELRDKIYRHLFNGFYYKAIYPSRWMLLDVGDGRILRKLKESGRDLSILRVSKAINHEAAEVLFLEGVFLCSLVFHEKILCLPQTSIDRMMKIELDVYVGVDAINETWEITLQKLNFTGINRKSIHVKFQGSISKILEEVPGKVSDGLRSLIGYRTVIVEFSIVNYHKNGLSRRQLNTTGRDNHDLWSLVDASMRGLKFTLGPATLSHSRVPDVYPYEVGVPGYTYDTICFQFHPSQHGLILS